ncbi:DUF305 domain-containing protein [Planomonospora venezuelensis]|uniref:Uncharacterized protein (DUF305 family) n=1 Tax=Planomonospora venezuelensis TaxID=1999 RepID=A0A841D454_PLAVE|nr:DUF305 domain-containing protein [Planomonospora venezuelensis]MBB5963168.1 uncharacterized protein (DUF305 family) [Planomonospora venezuelensis]GIN00044.1 DUF305 domain-containing protein [Planomonospora venezuelensis]
MKRFVPGVLLLAGLLAGCGAHSGEWAREAVAARASEAAAGRDFNSADVMFLQMMVAHNGQGVEIAGLARDRAAREEVRTLAAAIAATQEDEIISMAGLLKGWDQPATAPADEHAAHGGMPGTGRREIAAVADAAPADFEKRFLDTLIAHQDDAVQMAKAEVIAGRNPGVRLLAERIEASRTGQIEHMLELLDR